MSRFSTLLQSLAVNDKKWPWYYTLIWGMAVIWYGWLFSPIVVFYLLGVPKLEELQVLEGSFKIEGPSQVYVSGRPPPRYMVETKDFTTTVHCGPKPHPRGCYGITYACRNKNTFGKAWYDSYFGILQFECIESDGERTFLSYQHNIDVNVQTELGRDGKGAVLIFPLLLLLYAYQIRRVYRQKLTSTHQEA